MATSLGMRVLAASPSNQHLDQCLGLWYKFRNSHIQENMAHTSTQPDRPATSAPMLDETLAVDLRSRRVKVDGGGRIVVPAGFRKALGIRSGQEMLMSLDDGFVRLQTIDAALERVRAIARSRRRSDASVVDEFITERRAEAAAE